MCILLPIIVHSDVVIDTFLLISSSVELRPAVSNQRCNCDLIQSESRVLSTTHIFNCSNKNVYCIKGHLPRYRFTRYHLRLLFQFLSNIETNTLMRVKYFVKFIYEVTWYAFWHYRKITSDYVPLHTIELTLGVKTDTVVKVIYFKGIYAIYKQANDNSTRSSFRAV